DLAVARDAVLPVGRDDVEPAAAADVVDASESRLDPVRTCAADDPVRARRPDEETSLRGRLDTRRRRRSGEHHEREQYEECRTAQDGQRSYNVCHFRDGFGSAEQTD